MTQALAHALAPATEQGNLKRLPHPRPSTRRKRAHVMYAALGLFLVNGYTATTIDDILAATGLARRTFFRYFAGKEDIVLGNVADHFAALVEALEGRPLGTPPLVAIYDAILEVASGQVAFESSSGLALYRLISETPELKLGCIQRNEAWVDAVVQTLCRRGGAALPLARAQLIARSARAALDVSNDLWLASNGSISRITAVHQAFRMLLDVAPGMADSRGAIQA